MSILYEDKRFNFARGSLSHFTLSRDYDDLLYNTLVSKFGERVDIEFLDQNKSINSWTPVSEIAPYTLPEKGKKPTTVLIHLKKDEMDIYSKKSVSLTQKQQISRSQVDLKFSVKFPTFEKDLEFSSKSSFNDLLIYLSTICNKKVYSINIRGKIFDGNDGIEDISIINNEFITAYISEDEEEYGINYFDLKNRSPNNFYKCRCNEKINDCLKDCFKDKYYFYFPGGCYHIDEDKSWKDYPNFYVSNFGSKISLFGVLE